MRHIAELFMLPTSLLLLISSLPAPSVSTDRQWPYNLPSHIKYYPEEEVHVRRELDIEQRLAIHPPTGVRKMGIDEGEKFFLDYWQFEWHSALGTPYFQSPHESAGSEVDEQRGATPHRSQVRAWDENDFEGYVNGSIPYPFQPPFPPHTDDQSLLRPQRRWMPRAFFSTISNRAFTCPNQTTNCSSIGRPNSCCAQGETCQLITDSGLGDVGCCGQGKTCSGQVSTCAQGYTGCPSNPGGGCCIPNYACVDIGCALNATVTVVVLASASTTRTSTSTVALIPSAITSAPPNTTTAFPSTSRSATTLTCSTGYRSCPATLGGGCCPTDRQCGAQSCPESSVSAAGAGIVPAVRPTGSSTIVTTTTPPPSTSAAGISSTVTGTACPDGFYQCSAYYRGGCCRVGRDCGMTSCPTLGTTAILTSNGITIIALSGASIATANPSQSSASAPNSVTSAPTPTSTAAGGVRAQAGNGGCPSGWSSCAPSANGGCCPDGFSCETATCAAPAGATGAMNVGKVAPSGAARITEGMASVWWGLGFGVVMMVLLL
ncbi:MAG: hypothetical protein M1812_006851 [Candelaria pacifica]|nr:MAG: hypothetical protein M1812_006851 [Candelaria pacifica]